MSMMTGAMAPDGGSASFFGIRTLGPLAEADGLDRLRQLLGFCPQHDALFPRLTLREHLIFYSRLKGVEEARRRTRRLACWSSSASRKWPRGFRSSSRAARSASDGWPRR